MSSQKRQEKARTPEPEPEFKIFKWLSRGNESLKKYSISGSLPAYMVPTHTVVYIMNMLDLRHTACVVVTVERVTHVIDEILLGQALWLGLWQDVR